MCSFHVCGRGVRGVHAVQKGYTPFHFAALRANCALMTMLHEAGADICKETDVRHWSSLAHVGPIVRVGVCRGGRV